MGKAGLRRSVGSLTVTAPNSAVEWSDGCTVATTTSENVVLPLNDLSAELNETKLTALHIGQNKKIKITENKLAIDVIRENTGVFGSICFVVRRPGCGLCREAGWALNTLTTLQGKPLDGFGLFGVIKETGVDDEGVSDFQSFFPYPLYRDDEKAFYKAFGFRKMKMNAKNAVKSTGKAVQILSRLKQKKIKTNFKGEGFIQGGLIFFSPDMKPLYMYEEKTGEEVSVGDVIAVIDAIRAEYSVDL